MLTVIFTVDYEIHGNGEGCPRKLVVAPTQRLLKLLEAYGTKLTIMADVAEILRFKEYLENTGRDDFHYEAIVGQLRDAVKRGHDVQLHIHPSYFNARLQGGQWMQDWTEYNFANLPLERMCWMVRVCKEYLETELRKVKPDYRCVGFRAANWAATPSQNLVRALTTNGIRMESSVFKYGRRSGLVSFDYSAAPSNMFPWPVDEKDVCQRDESGKLWEFPIYCEERWVGAFFTPTRVYRAAIGALHRVPGVAAGGGEGRKNGPARLGRLGWLLRRHAWKADFNQCAGPQLISAIKRASRETAATRASAPFILIGHSKLFGRLNEWSLRPFLEWIGRHRGEFKYAGLAELEPGQR